MGHARWGLGRKKGHADIAGHVHTPDACRPSRAIARREIVAGLAALAVLGAAGAFYLKHHRAAAGQQRCLANLAAIGQAIGAYLAANNDRYPFADTFKSTTDHDPPWPTLPVALAGFIPTGPDSFRCPADRRTLRDSSPLLKIHPQVTTWHETEGLSYEWKHSDWYGGQKVGEDRMSVPRGKGLGLGLADQTMISDFEPFHPSGSEPFFNSLTADLRVHSGER